jgi:hypothetical protein
VASVIAAGSACGPPQAPGVSSIDLLGPGDRAPRVEGLRPRVVRRFAETFGGPISMISLIDTEEDWEQHWLFLSGEGRPIEPPIEIDFSRYMAVVGSWTMRAERGGGFDITDIVVAPSGDVHISAREVTPGPGCPPMSGSSYQRVVVFERPPLPRTYSQYVYVESVEGPSCSSETQ